MPNGGAGVQYEVKVFRDAPDGGAGVQCGMNVFRATLEGQAGVGMEISGETRCGSELETLNETGEQCAQFWTRMQVRRENSGGRG